MRGSVREESDLSESTDPGEAGIRIRHRPEGSSEPDTLAERVGAMSEPNTINWHTLAHQAGGYSPQVFEFVRDGLQHASEVRLGASDELDLGSDDSRHISGQDLCLGLRDLAIRRYGPLARTVLEHWNIHSTEDFGKVVFALINVGVLRKSDEDAIEDFRGVYEFDEAFSEAELI